MLPTLRSIFSVSEEDLLKYNNDLGTDAYLVLANDSVFASRGSVQSASGLITSQTGSATYTATFQNIGNVLRSGGFATVKIPYQMPNVIAIPQSATYEIQDKQFAFVVGKDNVITSKMIKTTLTNDGQFFRLL